MKECYLNYPFGDCDNCKDITTRIECIQGSTGYCGCKRKLDGNEYYEIVINNNSYIKVSEDELRNKCVSSDEYVEKLIELRSYITHWYCTEINDFGVTAGVIYVFLMDYSSGEYVVIDDNSEKSMVWLFVDGDLLIERNIKGVGCK